MKENEKRWENDLVRNRLEYLYNAFIAEPSIEKNKLILDEYQATLLNEVSEIHQMLQNIDYDHELKITPVHVPHGLGYMYDQLFDGIPAISNIGVMTFRPIVSNLVDVDDDSLTTEGVCIIIDAALWKQSLEEGILANT